LLPVVILPYTWSPSVDFLTPYCSAAFLIDISFDLNSFNGLLECRWLFLV
jgi:hypothetical protein